MNREQEIKSIKESQLKLADEQRKLADRLEALEKPEALKEGSIIETSDGYLAIIGRDVIIWLNKEVAFLSDKLPESGLHLANGSPRLGTFDEVFVRRSESMTRDEVEAEFVPKYMVSLVLKSAELVHSLGYGSRKTIEFIRKHLL